MGMARPSETHDLRTILAGDGRDFLVRNNGDRVPISNLVGQTVCLYFSIAAYPHCPDFTAILQKMYEELKSKGERFEVVFVSFARDEEAFKEEFKDMPWLALPCNDQIFDELVHKFKLRTVPTLVVIGPDWNTLHYNAAKLVEENGAAAFPFTKEQVAKLKELEKARKEAQTLESLLVTGELDYVIGKDEQHKGSAFVEVKVPVSELVGKTILFYFSGQWCYPCRGFTPKLIEAYEEIKAQDSAFEVIFVSCDKDEESFREYFSGMPWLALRFDDPRKKPLMNREFKISGIPSLVAIDPSGRTVTRNARDMIEKDGSGAYPFPFTEEKEDEEDEGEDDGEVEDEEEDDGEVEDEEEEEEEDDDDDDDDEEEEEEEDDDDDDDEEEEEEENGTARIGE